MIYQIVKAVTTERTYEVEANSAEEAMEFVDGNPNLYDDEEISEKITINGEDWYDFWL